MMKIMDAIIIVFLMLGAVIGFKKGFIKSLVGLLGIIICFVVSFYLKNPVVTLLYKYMPFWDFDGLYILNIFLYESLSFLVVFIICSSIWGIIMNVTKFVEKVLNATIILGIFSKVLGAIAGVLEMIVVLFVGLFVMARINVLSPIVVESTAANLILGRTPILVNIAGSTYVAFNEIYDLQKDYVDTENKEKYNEDALGILIKYNVISKDVARELIKNGKLRIPDTFVIY